MQSSFKRMSPDPKMSSDSLPARSETYGRLDCAFNNAARTDEVIGPMADLSEEDFDKTVSVNLKGVWLGMKYQIRQMLKQGAQEAV